MQCFKTNSVDCILSIFNLINVVNCVRASEKGRQKIYNET